MSKIYYLFTFVKICMLFTFTWICNICYLATGKIYLIYRLYSKAYNV